MTVQLRNEDAHRVLVELGRIQQRLYRGRMAAVHAVFVCCSHVEAYVDNVLRQLVARDGISRTPMGNRLMQQYADTLTASWDQRLRWLKSPFGIAIAGTPHAQSFLLVTELRNALAHSDGGLTERQKRGLPELLDLERRLHQDLGVQVEADTLTLSHATGAAAAEACLQFVRALDDLLLAAGEGSAPLRE